MATLMQNLDFEISNLGLITQRAVNNMYIPLPLIPFRQKFSLKIEYIYTKIYKLSANGIYM